ncbi:uncharacterized protein LOC135619851 isoform X1 [Musa acuminata AAA Group]|uniref:uncharacterized protein LOC135619851 isoform X1 n=1 Tax=Musa acuminata AAA Group TaxID=214697 RepID=UPI0031DCF7BA
MAALLCRFPSASSSRLLSPFSRTSKPRSLLLAVSPIMYSTLGPNYSSYSVAAAASASTPIALPSDAREPPPPRSGRSPDPIYPSSIRWSMNSTWFTWTMLRHLRSLRLFLNEYYESYNSNVHRGVHYLSAKATDAYEEARTKLANFVDAMDCKEIVFTCNATETINLVAYSWGLSISRPGDEFLQLLNIIVRLFPGKLLRKRLVQI